MTSYTVIPQNTRISVPVPSEYIGRQVLISISLETENQKRNSSNNLAKFSKFVGILSKERALEFEKHIEETRNEWDRNF